MAASLWPSRTSRNPVPTYLTRNCKLPHRWTAREPCSKACHSCASTRPIRSLPTGHFNHFTCWDHWVCAPDRSHIALVCCTHSGARCLVLGHSKWFHWSGGSKGPKQGRVRISTKSALEVSCPTQSLEASHLPHNTQKWSISDCASHTSCRTWECADFWGCGRFAPKLLTSNKRWTQLSHDLHFQFLPRWGLCDVGISRQTWQRHTPQFSSFAPFYKI